MKEPELIIENVADGIVDETDDFGKGAKKKKGEDFDETDEIKPKETSTLQQLREQASEDDNATTGTQTLRQIVGGDYLFSLVRNHIWLIVLVVLLMCIYVGVRYQCQQDTIEISRLEKELTDAKYRAMSSSSNLTEMCRQSNVLRVLHENEDTLLQMPEQPPFIVPVEE
ncbi:MAG: hypothetical protein J6Z14_13890 [Prevotella sp.]|nr:hypothetical protein [Prevotella sp.]